jgi:hypothetical protein
MNMIRSTSSPNALSRLFGSGFRRRRVARRVAVPGYFLQWLGIPEQELAAVCREKSLQTFSYIGGASDPTRRPNAAALPCPDELQETVTYATCVATDSLPTELDASHA